MNKQQAQSIRLDTAAQTGYPRRSIWPYNGAPTAIQTQLFHHWKEAQGSLLFGRAQVVYSDNFPNGCIWLSPIGFLCFKWLLPIYLYLMVFRKKRDCSCEKLCSLSQSLLQLGSEKKDLGWDLKHVIPLLPLFWTYLLFLKWDRQCKDSLKPENIKIIASKPNALLKEGLLIQLLNLQCKEMWMSEIPSQSKERLRNLIWPTPGFCFRVRQNKSWTSLSRLSMRMAHDV